VAQTVPFNDLHRVHAPLKSELLQALDDAIESSTFLAGAAATRFAAELGGLHATRYVTPVSNGTDALEVALRALDLPAGSEVLVPANSYVASGTAAVRAGLAVRFVDVDPDSLLLSAAELESKVTHRSRAVMVVHLYGQVARMDDILEVARANDLKVIEDCAQAQGASWRGTPAGSFGDVAAMSFYPGKNLGALGEAGAVLTNDQSIAERISLIANHGQRVRYVHETLGFNCRIDEIQAAFLEIKLRHLSAWNEDRRSIASRYVDALSGIAGLRIPSTDPEGIHARHLFPVLVDGPSGFMEYLRDHHGVETGRHYPTPIPRQGAFRAHEDAATPFPASDDSCRKTVSLPIFPLMTDDEVARVIGAVKDYFTQ
jgi:dTDP-4-amino-4,6-dideoxygalactose transaminase